MPKLINLLKKNLFLILVLAVGIPSFVRMLPRGIYSMQDFHLFRLYEFNSCVSSLQFPCRWAPDAGLGYGEPLFNYYGQFVYVLGEIFYLLSGSLINSIKALFIISLIGSGLAMYFTSKYLWKNDVAGLISAIIYIYAPYRAVDVYVRGALPEAFSFIFFPLIFLAIEKKNLFYFSMLTFLLVITHNLSFVMFLPLMIIWITYRKWWRGFGGILLALVMSSFYIIPVIFESKYVDLDSTTRGYFDFRAHFITLKQIFFDQVWGYGGSTWGDGDGLNLSIGIAQWLLPTATLVTLIFTRKIKSYYTFVILFVVSLIYIFLTHNKSTFIWQTFSFMKYIQFPWRFFSVALFSLALSSGVVGDIKRKYVLLVMVPILIYSIYISSYFRPDIWYSVNDSYFLNGSEWIRQTSASIGDYWPKFGHNIPDKFNDGIYINYFPGWIGAESVNGLIPASGTRFTDTPIRKLGNIISAISIIGLLIWKKRQK